MIKIREQFPEENGIYRNFEDNNNEGISEIVEAWECMVISKKNDFYIFMKTYIHSRVWYKRVIGIS